MARGEYNGFAISVPADRAQAAKDTLLMAGLLVGNIRPERRDGVVVFPVADLARAVDATKHLGAARDTLRVEAERPLRDPHDLLRELLTDALPPGLAAHAPKRWERVGHVILVHELDPVLAPHRDLVGHALARVIGVETVLEEVGGVAGEFREMLDTRVLFGTETVTTHREHHVAYRFDAARIMFSSGNVEERARMGRIDAAGETVADMFAGIGYFALPMARHAGAARVVAMEKNPVSHRFLVENARLNHVEDVLSPWLGDNREYPGEGFADRVLMGYFPGTSAFIPKALDLLKPKGGILHYHDTIPEDSLPSLAAPVVAAARDRGWTARPFETHVVKTYAPGIVHAVTDVRLDAP